jgi:ClpP class serine protease
MRPHEIYETLTSTPLFIAPATVDSLITLFLQHAKMDRAEFHAAREGLNPCGQSVELEQMTIEGSLAIIPAKGPMATRLGKFEKGAGATDYNDIISDIEKANEMAATDGKIQNIVILGDTPGGTYGGVVECADAIASSDLPVYWYCPAGGQTSSAGMYLAAACAGRFAAPSSSWGSIGVVCAIKDLSAQAAAFGIKVRVFSSGIYKGMGIPGTPLTDEQAAFLQENVLQLAQGFYDHIRSNLGDVPDEAMQGQSFYAPEAVKIGLADEVVKDLDALKEFLS